MKSEKQLFYMSVIDRLIHREGLSPNINNAPVNNYLTLYQLKQLIINDLEVLFNTNRFLFSEADSFPEIQKSILQFGINDYAGNYSELKTIQKQLAADIKRAIDIFEPRLKDATVQMIEQDKNKMNLSFKVTASISVEPVDFPIFFDTYFDITKQLFKFED